MRKLNESTARNLFGFFSGLFAWIATYIFNGHELSFWANFGQWIIVYGYGLLFFVTLTAINKYYGK